MLIDPADYSPSAPPGFIALEGLNGAGKSTLAKSLKKFLEDSGYEVVLTFEPGATDLGRHLRKVILELEAGRVSDIAEVFLFGADRAEHTRKVIRPALERGAMVVSDRCVYSTFAFQGYGRGIDLRMIETVMDAAVEGLYPDLTILLDLDPENGLRRNRIASGDDKMEDAFEGEDLEFHTRIREGFLKIAKERCEPFFLLNANEDKKAVFEQASMLIKSLCQCGGKI